MARSVTSPASRSAFQKTATQCSIGVAVGASVVVELDTEASEVPLVSFAHRSDQLLLASPLLSRPDHDRRAMGVVGTDVDASMAAQFLKANPDIRLDVFHQMPDMDRAVGVGQGTGNQNLACHRDLLRRSFNVRKWDARPKAAEPAFRRSRLVDGGIVRNAQAQLNLREGWSESRAAGSGRFGPGL